MKLDWDLLRSVLKMAEQCEGGCPLVCTSTAYNAPHYNLNWRDTAYSFGTVYEHMLLLGDAELAVVKNMGMNAEGPLGAVLERLTMRGHEFLIAAKNDHYWNKTKRVAEQVGGLSTHQFEALLQSQASLTVERTARQLVGSGV